MTLAQYLRNTRSLCGNSRCESPIHTRWGATMPKRDRDEWELELVVAEATRSVDDFRSRLHSELESRVMQVSLGGVPEDSMVMLSEDRLEARERLVELRGELTRNKTMARIHASTLEEVEELLCNP